MKKYQVLINVDDIWLRFEDRTRLMGYYQTFNVLSESPENAKLIAMEESRKDEDILKMWEKKKQTQPPIITAEDIVEVSEFENDSSSGRSFYGK